MRLRREHLSKVREAFHSCDVFVFTFGLTEAWIHKETGTVYPTAPGTLAGSFDPDTFAFRNYRHREIFDDFAHFRERMREINPDIRFVITTSPVPLTATASGQHVEVASTYSKAVLRAVCGELYDTFDDVDYFPSYEIITSQRAGGAYYEANLRSVTPEGVQMAMSSFMAAHGVEIERPNVRVGRIADNPSAMPADGFDAAALVESLDRKSLRELRVLVRDALARFRAGGGKADAGGGRPKRPGTGPGGKAVPVPQVEGDMPDEEDDVVCEEALLEAFSK